MFSWPAKNFQFASLRKFSPPIALQRWAEAIIPCMKSCAVPMRIERPHLHGKRMAASFFGNSQLMILWCGPQLRHARRIIVSQRLIGEIFCQLCSTANRSRHLLHAEIMRFGPASELQTVWKTIFGEIFASRLRHAARPIVNERMTGKLRCQLCN
jgi:hypothetical protein